MCVCRGLTGALFPYFRRPAAVLAKTGTMQSTAAPAAAKILVMTDLHIRGEGQTIIGLDPSAKLDAAIAHALALHKNAAALVLTGDLVHGGKVEEYGTACVAYV